jgi:hypothetical protein
MCLTLSYLVCVRFIPMPRWPGGHIRVILEP